MNNKKSLISVIMPFYNSSKYLKYSIESILKQTYKNFEFIIINDASTDDSDRIVKKYKKKDTRIIYIKNHFNKGITANLNYGLKIAKGKYIARMDGDDISNKLRFEKQVKFLENNKNITIVGTQGEIIDKDNNIISYINKPNNNNLIKKSLFFYCPVIHPSIMFNKKTILKVGGYDLNFKGIEDYELWFRLINKGYKLSNLNENLIKYRKYNLSNSYINSKEIAKKDFKMKKYIIKKYNLKIRFLDYIGIYGNYILGITISGKNKERIEKILKKILYNLL